MPRRTDPTTGERRPSPPTNWIITRACSRVLAELTSAERAAVLADPRSPRALSVIRGTLAQLDRTHGGRAGWLFPTPSPDTPVRPTDRPPRPRRP